MSHHALHDPPQRWIPIHPPEESAAHHAWWEWNAKAEWLQARGDLASADKARLHAHQITSPPDRTDRPVSLTVHTAEGDINLFAPTPWAIAAWLFQTPVASAPIRFRDITTASQRRTIDATYQALLSDVESAAPGTPQLELLTRCLQAGLDQRLGAHLTTNELDTYWYLLARGITAVNRRVCESCAIVHPAPRATHCPTCRKSPPRPRRRPDHIHVTPADKAPHRQTAVHIGNEPANQRLTISTTRRRGPTHTVYHRPCQDCGEDFTATDARTTYCPRCAKSARRTARSRARHLRR